MEIPSTVQSGIFHFDPTDAIYADHFPGRPVVPGSIIIHAFLSAMKNMQLADGVRIKDFRFQRFIRPGSYAYTLEPLFEEGSLVGVSCRLFEMNQIAAKGELLL